METFRIEVGRAHNVKPTNIVRAIANETGLESRCIGRIEIFDEHSTVDMRAGMPVKVLETLKQVKIGGRQLNMTRLDDAGPDDWPPVDAVKVPAPTAPEPQRESRPVAEMSKAATTAAPHSSAKKPKVKLKPKLAAPTSKVKRSNRKRLLPIR